MNEIRKNKDVEVDQVKLIFKVEPIVIVLYALKVLIGIGVIIGGYFIMKGVKGAEIFGIIAMCLGALVAVGNIIACILRILGVNKSEVTVSDQRIYGKYGLYLNKKQFSYRLDEISNIEIKDIFGSHSILINFEDGKGPKAAATVYYGNNGATMAGAGIMKLSCIKNYQEAYDVLNKMLLSVKTYTNLQTDIQMEKVSVEKEKVAALNKMADHIKAAPIATSDAGEAKNDNYIDEIKKLKELLDMGAITQAEFDAEKKEILDNNHK